MFSDFVPVHKLVLQWRFFHDAGKVACEIQFLRFLKIKSVKMSEFSLMIHWNLSTNLKLSSKNVWGNVFSYVKVCLFWKSIQYSIHWDKTQVLKNFPPDKRNGTKNVVYFLSQVPVYHSFTFDLKFLYDLKRKVCLSNTVSGFSIFDCVSFLLKFIFFNSF